MKLADAVVAGCRELMELVRTESRRMIDAQPTESAIGNMARRGQTLHMLSLSQNMPVLHIAWVITESTGLE